jgi:hypothetical protein
MRVPALRAALAAALLSLALAAGCTQEPSTSTDAGGEEALPNEPGAADPAPSPGAVDEDEDATRGED